MADEPIWTSAQILHPFKPGAYVKAFWLEARQPGVPRPPSNHTRGFLRKAPPPARLSSRHGSQGWGSSSDEDEHYSGNRVATPWVSSSSQCPPLPDERIPTPSGRLPSAAPH